MFGKKLTMCFQRFVVVVAGRVDDGISVILGGGLWAGSGVEHMGLAVGTLHGRLTRQNPTWALAIWISQAARRFSALRQFPTCLPISGSNPPPIPLFLYG